MSDKKDITQIPVNLVQKAAEKSTTVNKRALRVLAFPRKRKLTAEMQPDLPDASAAPVGPQQVRVQKAGKPGRSKAVTEDPFIQLQKNGLVIEPPFDLLSLAVMPEHNSELGPVVETMETNCETLGHLLKSRIELSQQKPEQRKAIHAEFVRLTNFFNYASIKDSWTDIRRKLRKDLEVTGNAFLEVIRDMGGEIQGVEHIPSYQMRLTPQEAEPIQIETPILELQDDDTYRVVRIRRWERFRKFVQSRAVSLQGSFARTTFAGYLVRWFKEFGDPRVIDNETGLFVDPSKVANWDNAGSPMPDVKRANEIIHMKLYSVRSPYGVPRYVGNLLSIVGDRASEEINFQTFKNNNIPSMALLVSNGQVSQGTIDRIEDFVESEIQGSDNYSKILIIEAEGPGDEGEDQGNIKLDIKPLQNAQPRDAFFQNYSKNNKANVRRAWRIPPIFTGCHSEDTEYLTENGWQLFGDIQEGAQIASYNTSSGAIEFDLPLARVAYQFDGEMLHLRNRGVDALVTPTHRFWTRPTVPHARSEKPWSFVPAEALHAVRGGNGGYLELPVSGSWGGERQEEFVIPAAVRTNAWDPSKPTKNPTRDLARYDRAQIDGAPYAVPMDAFLRFLGYFVSEGSTSEVRGPIVLSQNAGEVADSMIATLKELGFVPTVSEATQRPGQLAISVCHAGLWEWLRTECGVGSASKRFPRWVLLLSQEQIEIAMRAAVDGDGNEPLLGSEGAFRYPSTSSTLIDQMHEMGLRLGMATTSYEEYNLRENQQRAWCLYAHYDRRHLLHPKKQIRRVPYSGQVTCFTMRNGTLVTRRNGRILISGNSGEDYSRNVAETSRKLADEQVFSPERQRFDQYINRRLFPEMGVVHHEYQSNTPNTTDNKELVSILSDSEKTGGMTPRIARKVLEGILSMHLPEFPEDPNFNPDLPFSMAMAEAVKNKADPTEPGQQVTALKSVDALKALEALGIIGGQKSSELNLVDQEMVRSLIKLRDRLEKAWANGVSESDDDGSL